MRLRLLGFVAALLAVVSLAPVRASAQGWLADRDRAEGPGIRVGDLELHPGIGIELGYDSNIYYTSDDPAPGLRPRYDSGILRVTPHLYVSTIGQERQTEGEGQTQEEHLPLIAFRGGVSASYYEYFADERRRNVSLDVGLRLTVLPGRVFSFTVYDDFSRGIRPFTENTVETSTARDRNNAGIDFNFQTDGGVFQVRAGYQFGLDFFEGEQFRYGNSMTHTVSTQETFRFLPQTAIVHQLSVAYRDYFEGAVGPTAVFDSTTVSTRIGLNGAITPEISFLAMIGYAAGFYDSTIAGYDQDFESLIANAQLGWRIAENAQLQVGYQRSFQPSFVGNYSSQDRGYVNANMMFGGSFLLGIEAGVAYVDFGQMVAPDGSPLGSSTERTDVRVDASLFAEYRFTEWLGINGTVMYTGDFTDFRYNVDLGTMDVVLDPAGYNKVELWLGVRVFY